MEDIKKIQLILEHIKHVQENCERLGYKLIEIGEDKLGRNLIANGLIHDNSKLKGIEFDGLFSGSDLLKVAVKHHSSINPHHPEYWNSIHEMPDLYLAEMVCDCKARSSEFGTDIRNWFDNDAKIKYGYEKTDLVYTKIMKFLNLLLYNQFKKI
jgi:hypothetical protein